MKQYSYFLFPLFLIVLGLISIGVSVFSLVFSVNYAELGVEYHSLVGALAFLLIGLILTTFRASIKVDKEHMQVIKENRIAGFLLSKDIVRIPSKVNHILIEEKPKQWKGYIQGVVGFAYKLQSSDLYFTTHRGALKVISTDHDRALKIAGFLKDQLQLEYSIKKIAVE